MGRTRHTTAAIAIAVLTTFGLTACGADDDGDADEAAMIDGEPAEDSGDAGFGEFDVADAEAPAETADGDAARDVTTAGEATTGSIGSNDITFEDFGRDAITEVGLTMTTDDVAQTVADIRRLTAANGGAVFSSDVSVQPALEDGTVPGDGRMVVRIPPQDLDRLVNDLDGLGGVSRLTQDSQDVTDQLVDLEIRIRQAQAGIERIEDILARTTELDDLFSTENELTRRQVELERLLASQRATEDRVALATLTIDVRYEAESVEAPAPPDDDPGIADAFRDGWDAFVGALFAVGFVLAVMAPFLATALVVGGVILLVTRRLRRSDRTSPPATTTVPEGTEAPEATVESEESAERDDQQRERATVSDRAGETSQTA